MINIRTRPFRSLLDRAAAASLSLLLTGAAPSRPSPRVDVFEFPGITLVGGHGFIMPWPDVWGRATLRIDGYDGLALPGIFWRKSMYFNFQWSPDGRILAWRSPNSGHWRFVYLGTEKRIFHGPKSLRTLDPIDWNAVPPFEKARAEILHGERNRERAQKIFQETESRDAEAGLAEFLLETASQEPDTSEKGAWSKAFLSLSPGKRAFVAAELSQAVLGDDATAYLGLRAAQYGDDHGDAFVARIRRLILAGSRGKEEAEAVASLIRWMAQNHPAAAAEDACALLGDGDLPPEYTQGLIAGMWTGPAHLKAVPLALGAFKRPCQAAQRVLQSPAAACSVGLQCERRIKVFGLKVPAPTLAVPPMCTPEQVEAGLREKLAEPVERGSRGLEFAPLLYAAALRNGWDTSAVELRNRRRRYSRKGMPPNCDGLFGWDACRAALDQTAFEVGPTKKCPAARVIIDDKHRILQAEPR